MNPKRRLRQLRDPGRWIGIDEPKGARASARVPQFAVSVAATVGVLVLIAGVTFGLTHLPAPAQQGAAAGLTQCPAVAQKPASTSTARVLVPFTPTTALVCRYGGMNSGAYGSVTRMAALAGDGAADLATLMNSAAAHRMPPQSCPMGDASHVDIYFSGGDSGERGEVQVFETGCAVVTNGGITDVQLSSALRSRLIALVGSSAARVVAPAGATVPWEGVGSTPAQTWTARSALPACAPGQLTSWAQPHGGSAMSTYYQGVYLRNDGRTCSLAKSGISLVVGDDAAHARLTISDAGAAVLPAGSSEALQIEHPKLCAKDGTGDTFGQSRPTPVRLLIGTTSRSLAATMPWGGTCTGLGFTTWPSFAKGAFRIAGYPSATPDLDVSFGDAPPTGGGILHYTVRITNRGTRPYAPADCPSFVQVLRGAQAVSAQRVPLNCTGAGPIAPGATRTFAMVFSAPRDTGGVVEWFLVDGPGV